MSFFKTIGTNFQNSTAVSGSPTVPQFCNSYPRTGYQSPELSGTGDPPELPPLTVLPPPIGCFLVD